MISRRRMFGLVLLPLAPTPAWPMSLDRCSGAIEFKFAEMRTYLVPRVSALERIRDAGRPHESIMAMQALER